jgi:hypothetical protein
MGVVRAAQTIVVSSSGNENDVPVLEKPVYILESVLFAVIMAKNYRFDPPASQIL